MFPTRKPTYQAFTTPGVPHYQPFSGKHEDTSTPAGNIYHLAELADDNPTRGFMSWDRDVAIRENSIADVRGKIEELTDLDKIKAIIADPITWPLEVAMPVLLKKAEPIVTEQPTEAKLGVSDVLNTPGICSKMEGKPKARAATFIPVYWAFLCLITVAVVACHLGRSPPNDPPNNTRPHCTAKTAPKTKLGTHRSNLRSARASKLPMRYLLALLMCRTASALDAITTGNIKTAVDLWVSNKASAIATYGDIKDWDTSSVTSMYNLFYNKAAFNGNISKWNTS